MSQSVYLGHNNTPFSLVFLGKNKTLPFPLTMNLYLRFMMAIIFIFIFVAGMLMRKHFFGYLRYPETKLGAINLLIWMDQLNGLCLALSIVLRCIAICTPIPLVDIIGSTCCELIAVPVSIYLCGACVWSAFIGFYRLDISFSAMLVLGIIRGSS